MILILACLNLYSLSNPFSFLKSRLPNSLDFTKPKHFSTITLSFTDNLLRNLSILFIESF